ncbi:pentatricopeptide repeat-containing protein [Senna tora]|uniref:Pentatricopeptide repeat-containing protein n=1 Tax=Senna tora TaxID=362788 RepID=A0A835CH42_9FABA|nr:pentatricopeptide repeat-containing protein [Senna tora]
MMHKSDPEQSLDNDKNKHVRNTPTKFPINRSKIHRSISPERTAIHSLSDSCWLFFYVNPWLVLVADPCKVKQGKCKSKCAFPKGGVPNFSTYTCKLAHCIEEADGPTRYVQWKKKGKGEEDKVTFSFITKAAFAAISRRNRFLQPRSCELYFGLLLRFVVLALIVSLEANGVSFREKPIKLKCLLFHNLPLHALAIFKKQTQLGFVDNINEVTVAISLKACQGNSTLGSQIHGLAISSGFVSYLTVSNSLMNMYCKSGQFGRALRIFENLSHPDIVSWNTVLSGFEKKDVVSLFNEMRADYVYPNEVTFIGLIRAITIKNLVKEGLMIHGICIKSGFTSKPTVCNSLITMYAKFESVQESKKIFEELRTREAISWNALISGYAQNGMCKEAFLTFCLAIKEITPNQYTFGSVLNAIGAAEDISLKHGQRCHSTLLKLGLSTDPIVSGALLDMYAKRGSIMESQRVFSETPERTLLAWTAIISAYARHGDYESVMSLFEQMEMEKTIPDSITFLSVLTACCRKGMVDIGRKVFYSMINEYHIEPTPEHYSIMVDMLGRAGKLKEAEGLVRQIPGGPGLTVLQSLLGSCKLYGNIEMAEKVVDQLIEMEPTSSGTYVLMSNLYAEKGEWEKVATMRKGMRERGVRKEVGFSWVDVGNSNVDCLYLHGFSSGDMSHPESEEICRMAELLGLDMKFWKHRRRKREEEEYQDHN